MITGIVTTSKIKVTDYIKSFDTKAECVKAILLLAKKNGLKEHSDDSEMLDVDLVLSVLSDSNIRKKVEDFVNFCKKQRSNYLKRDSENEQELINQTIINIEKVEAG
jgi:hypothetical protein